MRGERLGRNESNGGEVLKSKEQPKETGVYDRKKKYAALLVAALGVVGVMNSGEREPANDGIRTEERAPRKNKLAPRSTIEVAESTDEREHEADKKIQELEEQEAKHVEEERRNQVDRLKKRLQNIAFTSDTIEGVSGDLDPDNKDDISSIYRKISSEHEWSKDLDLYDLTDDERDHIVEQLQENRLKAYLDGIHDLQIKNGEDGLQVGSPDGEFYQEFWVGERVDGGVVLEVSGEFTRSWPGDEMDVHADRLWEAIMGAAVRDAYQDQLKKKMLEMELGENGAIAQLVEGVL